MGLALANRNNTPDSPSRLTEDRGETASPQPRGQSHQHGRRDDRQTRRTSFSRAHPDDPRWRLRERQIAAVEIAQSLHSHSLSTDDASTILSSPPTPRTRSRNSVAWPSYNQQDLAAALSSSPVFRDYDDAPSHRPPSLERQEAFVDSRTSRRRLPAYNNDFAEDGFQSVDAEEVADLYHLDMLLYDEEQRQEQARRTGFNFNALMGRRDGFPYTLDPRRTRLRVRRRKAPSYPAQREFGGSPFLGRGNTATAVSAAANEGGPVGGNDITTPRPLSEYDPVANFLIAPDGDELGDDDDNDNGGDDFDVVSVPGQARMRRSSGSGSGSRRGSALFGYRAGAKDLADSVASDWVIMSDEEGDLA